MSQEFVPLAENIVEAMLKESPATAAFAGDHRFDTELPDYSPDGVLAQLNMLRDASDALSQLDSDSLPLAEQVDHAILTSLVERSTFELSETRSYEWNPMLHNPGSLLHSLMARPFAPVPDRLESIAARLEKIPDALAVARGVLRDCPKIHLETAAGQFTGTASMIRDELPKLLAESPGLKSRVVPVADAASKALEEFSAWCASREGERDPRLGRRLWDAKLWYTLDTELTAAEVLKRAWSCVEEVTEQLKDLAPNGNIRELLDRLADDHPDNDTIVALAQESLEDTTNFVREHDLVTLVDDPCIIQEMPEFNRGIAVAYCDPPGVFEPAHVPTYYCISPTPNDWTPERVTSFFREYNNHMVRNLTVHEAMPGHFLQLAHSRRYRGSSRVRALGFSGPFVEGWAVYTEEMMVQHGFGGMAVRAQQLKMQLRMAINAILDQLVHCEELSEADGMELMLGKGFQEEGEAAGKWRRAQLSSTQLSTYFVGYSEVRDIARLKPANVPLRQWHDAMLSHGSPSPRHLRTLLQAGV
ncbi:DUF885 domain-containing protein [Catelliglobosispora koreensis]|uniref:DUF885 domain-containing protein n=1 Tax=Catelliglobosispora koreensis TaxID=129052 RepID=UPI0003721B76|nr:DUF885 domain-containing protein [Catelliglobosispora koreensis]